MKKLILKTLITLVICFIIISPMFFIEPINKVECHNEYSNLAEFYTTFIMFLFGWILGKYVSDQVDKLF